MSPRAFLILGVFSLLVLFVAGNALAARLFAGAQLDLTEDRLYTLSPGTVRVLEGLPEPIALTLYYSRAISEALPAERAFADDVRQMLRAYVARSRGRLSLEIIDPAPVTPQERRALDDGIEPRLLFDADPVYFGVAARSLDDRVERVGSLTKARELTLEFELTRMLQTLARPQAPQIAVYDGLDILPPEGFEAAPAFLGPQGSAVGREIAAAFDLVRLEPGFDRVPDDVDALLLLHPSELPEASLAAIDGFMASVGRALMFLDPVSEVEIDPSGFGPAPTASDLPGRLAAWGLAYDPAAVVLDPLSGLQVLTEEDGRPVARAYPLWIELGADRLDPNDLVTATLGRGVVFASAGGLGRAGTAGITVTALATTSEMSLSLPADRAAGAPPPRALIEGAAPAGPQMLAARVEGPLGGPDGVAGRAIVVADTDLLADRFAASSRFQPGAPDFDNAAFVLNALELLAGDDALATLRARARADRPMTRVLAIEAEADAQYLGELERLEAERQGFVARLAEVQAGGVGSSLVAGERTDAVAAVEAEARRLVDAIAETDARLRSIRADLRRDLDRLEAIVAFVVAGLAPLLVILLGVGVGLTRRPGRREGSPA